MKSIKAALFDLDGTLLDRDRSVRRFAEKQHERLSGQLGQIPKEKYVSRFIQLDCRGYVWKDKVYQQLLEEFNIDGITWEEMLQDYLETFKYDCIPFSGLTEILEELKSEKLVLGMITNGYGRFQMENIMSLEIEKYFDVIAISEWEGIRKPDSRIFTRTLEKLHVAPNESVFIGDHPDNDIKAAQNAGMKAIWKKDSQWMDVEADAMISSLRELPATIKTLHKTIGL